MGNTPSADAHRRAPQRLSKPRVGNPSTAGLLNPNGFVNSPGRRSLPALPVDPSSYPPSPSTAPTLASVPVDEALATLLEPGPEPLDKRVSVISVQRDEQKDLRRRSSLFRSRSSQRPPQRRQLPTRRHSIIGPPRSGRALGDTPARANSMSFDSVDGSYYGGQPSPNWPSAGSRTSWNYDLASYEAKRLLNLVEEPASFEQNSTMSESKFTVLSETTWKSSHPARPESTPINRANSDMSLYTPVRRRSVIQTPGVATRRNSNAGPTKKASFRHSHPPTPSLSRQASFESNASRVLSMPPLFVDHDSAPRVLTPVDGDYKTIGAFKLGSLRITNGAASPTRTPNPDRDEDSEKSGPVRSPKSLDYFSSTRKLATGVVDESKSGVSEERHSGLIAPTPKHVAAQLSPIATSFETTVVVAPPLKYKSSPTAGSDLRGEYLTDLIASPQSLEPTSSTGANLQTTSKHTALEDELFEDEAQAEYSSVEVLEVRLDRSAKRDSNSDSLQASASTTSTGQSIRSSTFSRSDSGFIPSPTSDFSHKPLSKADSGYSSNVSLRSLRNSSKPPVPEKDLSLSIAEESIKSPRAESFFIGELSLPGPTITAPELELSTPEAPDREAPPPPPPPKDYPPTSPVPRSMSSMSTSRGPTPVDRPQLSLIGTSAIELRRKAVGSPPSSPRCPQTWLASPEPLSPASFTSDVSASALSIGSGSQRPGKLQRLLSFSTAQKGPPTVHTTHVEDRTDIPSVPQHVGDKYQEHTGLFPITTKRLTLRGQLSRDTLKTIFSVGSLEVHDIEPQPAVVPAPDSSDEAAAEPKPSGRRHSFVHSTLVQALRKPIARKPVPARKEAAQKKKSVKEEVAPENILDVEAELTTYISVNNSLGNNPYDAAFMAMRDERETYFSPVATGRTMSMTAQLERSLDMRMAATKGGKAESVTTETALLSPGLPSPAFPEMLRKTKSPPPVSMRTQRRPNALRVPPPLRPQSTPPISRTLSRQDSQDSIRSYLSYKKLLLDDEDSKSPPAIPPMNPRRSMHYQDPRSPTSQTDRGSRRSSIDHSRNNSFSSRSQASPDYPPPRQHPPGPRAAPPLRHRASHDGFSNSQRQSWAGYSQPLDGYANNQPYDPWNQPPSSFQQWAPPPYVPRGHYRNRSMGNRHVPGQPPYRILHSYNSPAYRGVPIWG